MNVQRRRVRAKAKARANRLYRAAHSNRNYNRSKPRSGPLLVSRGPGSINAESELRQLVLAGHEAEAAEYWNACHRIYYRGHGGTRMRWGNLWYAHYKLRSAA